MSGATPTLTQTTGSGARWISPPLETLSRHLIQRVASGRKVSRDEEKFHKWHVNFALLHRDSDKK
ncbi:hypothetical protein EYF80_020809 [Liparis tanakae]|uniref:Uncharacterized protein n=1 Tax=Liparis tanakae TaxID=230148 RepID=A0A4Z2HT69_9TELE|nr:hypothetical protein EYF80_020809 [Liparis tanakae]